jgi:hypothetical protein
LFSPDRVEITATSTLIYPVFRGAEMKNFTGAGLDLSRSVLFRAMLDTLLAPRVRRAPNALVIPFGIVAGSGVRYLCENNGLSSDRVLWNMPHPSEQTATEIGNSRRMRKRCESSYSDISWM